MNIGSIETYKDCFIFRTGLFCFHVLSPNGIFIRNIFTLSGAHKRVDLIIDGGGVL